MKLERRNPIPPGRYWIDVIGKENIDDFGAWIIEMQGAVRLVTSTEDTESEPPQLWALFEVPEGRSPFLDQQKFGFPTTAPEGVKNKEDTEQGGDDDDDGAGDVSKAIKILAVVGVALAATVGLVLLTAWTEGKKRQLEGTGPASGTRVKVRESEAA
jgi:hypothetical protein